MRQTCIVATLAMCLAAAAGGAEIPEGKTFANSLGMKFVLIEPGTFDMGFDGKLPDGLMRGSEYLRKGNYDERPVHKVKIGRTFYTAATEVTNAQYEAFDPAHKKLRGKLKFSKADDEAVVFVNWHEATAFCRWLSKKEGRPYRLPTEAEWEYACRAGTTTQFSTGDALPEAYHKNARESYYPCTTRSVPGDIVPLTVGKTPPNPWGLFDMHGNVEEWCSDIHGPYTADEATDPVGRACGLFRVTRGGSHSTPLFYLRSANRAATIPDDKNWMIGFRVVLGEPPATKPLPAVPPQPYQRNVEQRVPADIADGTDPTNPHFRTPRPYIRIPKGSLGPLFYYHNHCPSIVQCNNGDLLASWFSTWTEGGREAIAAVSRLRHGADEWEPASILFAPPDHDVGTTTLWVDADGTVYHFSALAVAQTAPSIIMQKSTDHGATWSEPRTIVEHGNRNQVMPTVFRTRDGAIVLPVDAVRDGRTSVFISRDDGKTWRDPGSYKAGERIAGIHAPIVERSDGSWLALGRYDDIDGRMPKSVSTDQGKTWKYSASEFRPISGGQRATMMKLKEGPLLFASFTKNARMRDARGERRKVSGLFAALSYDEGKTWPVKRLVSDGSGKKVISRKNKYFKMEVARAEGGGYLAICQSPNGLIHMVSNRVHYEFNMAWLTQFDPKGEK